MPFIKKNQSQDASTSSHFIGRTGEILFFVHNVLQPDAPTYNILSISGQGGVGKSTLLTRFIALAHEAPFKDYCLTASVDERQATPIGMMEKFAQQLHLTGKFEKALKLFGADLRVVVICIMMSHVICSVVIFASSPRNVIMPDDER